MSEWISVNDRLPKHNKKIYSKGVEVIVWPSILADHVEVSTAFYGKRVNAQSNFYLFGAVIEGITHWMPLPEPPEEEA